MWVYGTYTTVTIPRVKLRLCELSETKIRLR